MREKNIFLSIFLQYRGPHGTKGVQGQRTKGEVGIQYRSQLINVEDNSMKYKRIDKFHFFQEWHWLVHHDQKIGKLGFPYEISVL